MAKKTKDKTEQPLVIKTEWDLRGIFGYEDFNDPKIDKDVKKGIRQIKAFAKKWSNRDDWLTDPKVLKEALDEYEVSTAADSPIYFLYMLEDVNLSNTDIKGKLQKISDEISKAAEQMYFFSLRLEKVDKKIQKKFLKAAELGKYHHWLKDLFEHAKYSLSEAEEKILSRTFSTRSELWVSSLGKELGTSTIEY